MIHNLADIEPSWDVIVIGGGITGAGIFRESVAAGLKTVLLEQKDFAWGTSSRSSKLVHGGLRYLRDGHFLLTKASVEERERLLQEAPGLVENLPFLLPVYRGQSPGKRLLGAGLTVYDLIALKKQHRYWDRDDFIQLLPALWRNNLTGGYSFSDASVDDARLVLRLITESVSDGGTALNYATVTSLKKNNRGDTVGVTARDTETGLTRDLAASVVMNATGAWAETLHPSPDTKKHIRPLRGSHIVMPAWLLPVTRAVMLIHPVDERAVFVIPWEGVVIVGTTDIDHTADLSQEPVISDEEIAYLLEVLHAFFPSYNISADDCISTFSGVRPVLSSGDRDPSQESRDHTVWTDRGLVTVTGGKLTTFRLIARDAMKAALPFLHISHLPDTGTGDLFHMTSMAESCPDILPQDAWLRLIGRYGAAAGELVSSAAAEDLAVVPGTRTLWAEIPFTASREGARHLSDILLRRVRIGLITPEGGRVFMKRIQALLKPVLPWDAARWDEELEAYSRLLSEAYGIPGTVIAMPQHGFYDRFAGFLSSIKNSLFRGIGP